MAEWTENYVNISGPEADIQAFQEHVNLNFDDIVPLYAYPQPESPDHYLEYLRQTYWGTKHKARHVYLIEKYPDHLVYTLDTAWGPPTAIVNALRDQYPTLDITWEFQVIEWDSI